MQGFKAKCGTATVVILSLWIALASLYGLFTPISNGCLMTYMYPTYIPIPIHENLSSAKYGLYLYHEGWKHVDFKEHISRLNGIPIIFIPGNGGSYKQVRSLAAESHRAYVGGPMEHNFYQEALLNPEEGGYMMDMNGSAIPFPNQYHKSLDWFAVDLDGEHSAMDSQILEEHTEYVIHAIHWVLDQYKISRGTPKEGAATSGISPKSVILVGHSMGGFVARAAVVHPYLRKFAVETILTLSSPHQSPPLAVQPSLGHYFARVNKEWRNKFAIKTSQSGHYVLDPVFSNIVVISISGGINDYQVRTKLESLHNIVPPTHGFMISSTSMKNVWLSMEHQVSHTLLSLVDPHTGMPLSSPKLRLAIFSKMLRSGIPLSLNWMRQSQSLHQLSRFPVKHEKGSTVHTSSCPNYIHWSEDGLDRDLYIRTPIFSVLAMDGKRRWLDIQKLASNGKSHFMLVTNFEPCSGIRLHLWSEKRKSFSNFRESNNVVEVTSKMVHIPSGPPPRQIEPGSQTEQPPPSAVFWLGPEELEGFRFFTVSVAPRPAVSGRPPPAASMAVGQFFNPEDGERVLSNQFLFLSLFSKKEMMLGEGHPLAFSLSFGVSLGLLPVTLSLETSSCGIKNYGLPFEEAGDMENTGICKLRCFPPVALSWDTTSGLHIFPILYSKTILVDSFPAVWGSRGSEKTTVLLLMDPHCSYKSTISISITAAASRFFLLYSPLIVGLVFAVIFFALMQQSQAWDLDLPIPSMLAAVESNLRIAFPSLLLVIIPILISLIHSSLTLQPLPQIGSYITVSIICYIFSNGAIIILILVSQLIFYVAALLHILMKTCWKLCVEIFPSMHFHWLVNFLCGSLLFKVMRVLNMQLVLVTGVLATAVAFIVHPALGLSVLLASHAFCCHDALCSFLMASNPRLARRTHTISSSHEEDEDFESSISSELRKGYAETQIDIFHHRHGLLILQLLALLMFLPSFVAWFQKSRVGKGFPNVVDSSVCVGVILHGMYGSRLERSCSLKKKWMGFIYLLAGFYSFLCALALSPYRVLYVIPAIPIVSFAFRIMHTLEKSDDPYLARPNHSHRH